MPEKPQPKKQGKIADVTLLAELLCAAVTAYDSFADVQIALAYALTGKGPNENSKEFSKKIFDLTDKSAGAVDDLSSRARHARLRMAIRDFMAENAL